MTRLLEVNIIKYVPPGDGFGVFQGKAVFISGTAVGDVVTAYVVKERRTHYIARLWEVKIPSPDRIDVPCPHYFDCGGCSLMHLSLEKQLDIKRRMLVEVFSNQALRVAPTLFPSAKPFQFRYRTQLGYREGKIGFFKGKTHTVVEVPECKVLAPELLERVAQLTRVYTTDCEYLLLESLLNGEVAGTKIQGGERSTVPGLTPSIQEDYGSGPIELLSDGFAQSNPSVTAEIVQHVEREVEGVESVCELYCGCGTFSIPVAKRVGRLIGYDIGEGAIQMARKNAAAHYLTNTIFKVENIERLKQLPQAEVILVDPPRKGLGLQTIQRIASSVANRLIYISCDPSTLARDVKWLKERGNFELSSLRGFDMYVHSTHLETLSILVR